MSSKEYHPLVEYTVGLIQHKYIQRRIKNKTFSKATRNQIDSIVTDLYDKFYNEEDIKKILKLFVGINWKIDKRFPHLNKLKYLYTHFLVTDYYEYVNGVIAGDEILCNNWLTEWNSLNNNKKTRFAMPVETVVAGSNKYYQLLNATVGIRERTKGFPWSFRVHCTAQIEYFESFVPLLLVGHATSPASFGRTEKYIKEKYLMQTGGNSPLKNIMGYDKKVFMATGKSRWDLRKGNEEILQGVNTPFDYPYSKVIPNAGITITGLDRI